MYDKKNLALLTDFYELTMGKGYFHSGLRNKIAYFDIFFRQNPDEGGYSIVCGIEQIAAYIRDLHFEEDDIEYLRSKGIFDEEFLDYLRHFRFSGDIWAIPEGSVIFPGEPIMTVRAPVIEAQLIETYCLLTINHQSLVATKASRMVYAAEGRPISEFGSRRAHGEDAAVMGARAAFIGGCASTACALSDKLFGVPAGGTMAHSWVQMFDSEYDAFTAYIKQYPENPTFLVDTYSVLKSGIPAAIRAVKDHLWPLGKKKCGIRIDSGDITYLTVKARRMLDEAGLTDCKIFISNSLDEYIIAELFRQGAQIDGFGVGERLITAKSDPVFGGVYKLAAIENEDGTIVPRIKVSENVGKITNPHVKELYRFYDNETGKAEADLITLADEVIPDGEPIEIFDPEHTWKRKLMENYTLRKLRVQIFKNGEQVYEFPPLEEMRDHCQRELATMWDSVRRFENPHVYYVDLSQRLWDLKHKMLDDAREMAQSK